MDGRAWRAAGSGPGPIPSPDGGGGACASVFPSRFRPSICGGSGTSSPQPPKISPQQHSATCGHFVLKPPRGDDVLLSHTLGHCPVDLPVQWRGLNAAQGDGHCGEGPPASLWGFCRDSGPRQLAASPLLLSGGDGAPGLPAAGPVPAGSMRASHPQALLFPTKPLRLAFHLIRRTFNPPVRFRDRFEPGWGCEALTGSL